MTIAQKTFMQQTAVQKLEALKYNLTELIIHDLKSPIMTILSAIDLYEQRKKTSRDPYMTNFTAKIKRNCQLQLDLISDILEINKMENSENYLEKRKIHLPAFLEDCIIQIEPFLLLNGIRLKTGIEKNMPSVVADERYLNRIFINILMNSIKYSERDSSISVEITRDRHKKYAVFCVKDEGLGIEKEYVDKIFDRFFQVNPSSKRGRRGVGLGLAFCRMAVEAHGGTIWAKSVKGKGSAFYFTLPLSP